MNKLTREEAVLMVGESNVNILETGKGPNQYEVTGRLVGEDMIEFSASITIPWHCEPAGRLTAYVLQDEDLFARCELDELIWDKPDYYTYEEN